MKKACALGFISIIFLFSLAAASGPDDIVGKWWNEKKDAQINIYKCDAKYCGRIDFLKEPVYPTTDNKGMAGKAKVDRENPDSSKRGRAIIGLDILSGFNYDGKDVWENGTIYNPEDGKTYKCKLTLDNHQRLKVRGYVGTPILGKTQYWTKVQ